MTESTRKNPLVESYKYNWRDITIKSSVRVFAKCFKTAKMLSFKLITSGLTVIFAISLYRCEVSEENYNTLLTKMKSPIRSERLRFSEEHGKDRFYVRSRPQYQAFCKHEKFFVGSSEKEEENKVTRNNSNESMFAAGFRDLRLIYKKCQANIKKRLRRQFDGVKNNLPKMREKLISFYNCMKVFSFRQLDDFLSYDVVPISKYLEFVRDTPNATNAQGKREDHSYDVDILTKNWIDLIVERTEKLLNGHSLKFRIGYDVNQGRGRRRDHRMFAMMMMGFVIMASILVPMGFQFLTVLGGKSLLMAKMALIMSAINGLKKIATSNVGYGLYHAGPESFHHDPHHHGFHEKIFHIKAQEQPESPFNVVI